MPSKFYFEKDFAQEASACKATQDCPTQKGAERAKACAIINQHQMRETGGSRGHRFEGLGKP